MTVVRLSSISLLLLFCNLCHIPQTDQTTVSNSFVKEFCVKYEELSNVCLAVVDSDPHQDLKLNASGLLAIFINHSIANATDNHMYLVDQLKNSKLDNKTREIFDRCADLYERGIEILASSLEALLKDQTTEMSDNMTGVYDLIVSCEYAYEDTPPEPPSWLSRYLAFRPLLELSMGAANFLRCKRVAACIPYI